ncbi:hypothetical protein SAMN05428969_2033 [Devosia sp. YR412]|uniref:hypothetical protein n=1 Tax=Devosia sp. YR412 TaxID=1881030 RepID=UPI0008B9FB2D|nr:hypothetical protein [Devosia sp. YR412]SEQ11386.1 hypothetical protein SAMN05428969_2033 [Devosia sp. YR412]
MDEPKQSPFALNPGRVLILCLGVLIVIIAISTSLGGINAYQSLREANAEATTAAPIDPAVE